MEPAKKLSTTAENAITIESVILAFKKRAKQHKKILIPALIAAAGIFLIYKSQKK